MPEAISRPAWQGSVRLAEAAAYAIDLHSSDARKGTDIPYVAHLFSVCGLVIADGGSEDEAIAGLLHDALEDHPERTSRAEIARRFGERAAEIVAACSDTPADYAGGPKPIWKERKTRYLAHLLEADRGTLRVALADKLDNARAMLADHRRIGDALWSRFNAGKADQIWYLTELARIFSECRADGLLLDEFLIVVQELARRARET